MPSISTSARSSTRPLTSTSVVGGYRLSKVSRKTGPRSFRSPGLVRLDVGDVDPQHQDVVRPVPTAASASLKRSHRRAELRHSDRRAARARRPPGSCPATATIGAGRRHIAISAGALTALDLVRSQLPWDLPFASGSNRASSSASSQGSIACSGGTFARPLLESADAGSRETVTSITAGGFANALSIAASSSSRGRRRLRRGRRATRASSAYDETVSSVRLTLPP